jgi:hypothetical protein
MASLDITFSTVYTKVSEFLGLGSSPTGSDLTLAKDIVYRGYRKFLYPVDPKSGERHLWQFLQKDYTISTQSDVWQYPLPSDFREMVKSPQFEPNSGYPELMKVSRDRILNRRAYADTQSWPIEYAIVPLKQDNELGTRWEMWLWPNPSGAYNITCTYIINPDKPEQDTDLFLGGPWAGEVVLECALAVAEQQEDDLQTQHHTQVANQMLAGMIRQDVTETPSTMGKLRGPWYRRNGWFSRMFTKIPSSQIYFENQ